MLSEYQFWVYLAAHITRDAIKIDCIKDNKETFFSTQLYTDP
jgi:hypothetical protein